MSYGIAHRLYRRWSRFAMRAPGQWVSCGPMLIRLLVLLLAACTASTPTTYPIDGVVEAVPGPTSVVVAHQAIPGFMDAMTMLFRREAGTELRPGDRITATLVVGESNSHLVAIRVVGHQAPSPPSQNVSIRTGQRLPNATVALASGGTLALGAEQRGPLALTFLYTTCPLPEFCPAIAAKLQQLQAGLAPGQATLLAITLDTKGDTPQVLNAYGARLGARSDTWQFGRVDDATLARLAKASGLVVDRSGQTIEHGIRLLVFAQDGTLIERYDDARWPNNRVISQLTTGKPLAPPGIQGTVTPN